MLPRRTGGYSQTWLDSLCASGELVWWARRGADRALGPGGAVLPRGRALRSARPPRGRGARARSRPLARSTAAACSPGAGRASSPICWPSSTPRPRRCGRRSGTWCGREATNDAWAPLRAPHLALARAARESARAARAMVARPRFGARRGDAQSQVQGRWSLTGPVFAGAAGGGIGRGGAKARTRRAAARALWDRDPRAGARRGDQGRLRDAV